MCQQHLHNYHKIRLFLFFKIDLKKKNNEFIFQFAEPNSPKFCDFCQERSRFLYYELI